MQSNKNKKQNTNMKLLLITLSLMVFSINAQEVPLYETIQHNVPKVGEKREVYLGDRMLIQQEGEYRECIIPKITLEGRLLSFVATIKKNKPICKEDADAEMYAFTYKAVNPCEGCSQDYAKLIEKKGKYEIRMCNSTGRSCPRQFRFKDIDKDKIEIDEKYFLYDENTFQQSIEYAGRDEDNLKFTYSEFTDGFARQAFTREFQIDYAKGDVAAYKGAIIKIHDATNVNIVYEVIRNFQQ